MTRRYTCCQTGTTGAFHRGRRRNWSTSFVVLPGTVARPLAGCFDSRNRDALERRTGPGEASYVSARSHDSEARPVVIKKTTNPLVPGPPARGPLSAVIFQVRFP